VISDITVNLIDTPGHADFIAEVERVMGVLAGAVLVMSAVEGVQAQTRVSMRTLQRLGIPTLIFVNKIDAVWTRACSKVLPALTRGEGVLESAYEHYQPVEGTIPTRPGERTTTRSTAKSTCCASCGGCNAGRTL
jgi:ribosomal protection tetracycline resistance protein